MLEAWGEKIEWASLMERLALHSLDLPLQDKALEQLVLSQAFQDYHLVPMEDESSWLVEEYRQTFQKLSEPQQRILASDAEKQYKVKQALLLQERIRRLKHVVVSQNQVHQSFLDSQGQYERLLFQLLRVSSAELAQKLYGELATNSTDFDYMVRQYGEGPEVPRGGLIGPVQRSNVHMQIANTLLALQPGQVSSPIQLKEGHWLILRLIQHTPAVLTPEIEKIIQEKLYQDWFSRQVEKIKQPAIQQKALTI